MLAPDSSRGNEYVWFFVHIGPGSAARERICVVFRTYWTGRHRAGTNMCGFSHILPRKMRRGS